MRRIATGSNRNPAIDLFGTGKHGFKTGNRSLGDPPSTPGGEWYNSVQEELARAIEGADIALDAAKYDQLLAAIKSIAWGAGKTSAPWAPLASPALTDTPTTPTAADGTNTAQIASTAFVQSAVGGYLSKSVTGGTVTLSDLEASNPVIGFSGTLTSNLVVVVPTTVKRLWAVYNATGGAFTLTVKTATGSGVTVAQGKRNLVYTDGTNVYDGFNDFENIALTGAPTAPTASTGTRSTQLATTAFVGAESQIAAPTGSVYTFAGSTVPTGWLKCNGALLSRTTYAALFAVIGTTYGAGDGSTTFALPDLRGEFVRGFDDARGIDSGRTLGSSQSAYAGSLTINSVTINVQAISGGPPVLDWITINGNAFNDNTNTVVVPVTPGDNRPRNVAMHYIIKY